MERIVIGEGVTVRGNLRGTETEVVGRLLFYETRNNPYTLRRNRYAEGVEERQRASAGEVKAIQAEIKSGFESRSYFVWAALRGHLGEVYAKATANRIRRSCVRAVANPLYAKDAERAARAEEQGRLWEVAQESAQEAITRLIESPALANIGNWNHVRYHLPEDSAYAQCKAFLSLSPAHQSYLRGQTRGNKKRLWERAGEIVERFAGKEERFDSLVPCPRATLGTLSDYQGVPTSEGNRGFEPSDLQAYAEVGTALRESQEPFPCHILGFARWAARREARRLYSLFTSGKSVEIMAEEEEQEHLFTSWERPEQESEEKDLVECTARFLRTRFPRLSPASQRAILLLLFGGGFTHREIASAVGISVKAIECMVGKYLPAAKAHLREILEIRAA